MDVQMEDVDVNSLAKKAFEQFDAAHHGRSSAAIAEEQHECAVPSFWWTVCFNGPVVALRRCGPATVVHRVGMKGAGRVGQGDNSVLAPARVLKRCLTGTSEDSWRSRQRGDSGWAAWPMLAPPASNRGVAVRIPLDRGAVDHISDLPWVSNHWPAHASARRIFRQGPIRSGEAAY
jgi:hypothetical protein